MAFALTLPIQKGSLRSSYHFSLAFLFLLFGTHLVINSPIPSLSPMGILKAGKGVGDATADLGSSAKNFGAVDSARELKTAGSLNKPFSTGSQTSELNVLRKPPELAGTDLKQVGQGSKFSNPNQMATGASQIGSDTARQAPNTIQGSKSIGSVLKSFGNAIYRTYYRIVARYHRWALRSDSRTAGQFRDRAAKAVNPKQREMYMKISNRIGDGFTERAVKIYQASKKAGIKS